MGLDMYFFARATRQEQTENLVAPGTHHEEVEIGYFRKFHDLNNFLGSFYPEGINDFNCMHLELTPGLLEHIVLWGEGYMPDTEWGREQREELLIKVIPAIQKAFDEGRPVHYIPRTSFSTSLIRTAWSSPKSSPRASAWASCWPSSS